jgi:hypothetical protein
MRWRLGWILLLAGCSDSGPADPTRQEIAGTYTLRAVNGAPLPFASASEGVRILSSEIHLTEFASAAFMLILREPFDKSDTPSQSLINIGWGPTTGDSIFVNVLLLYAIEPHPGRVVGDTALIRSDPFTTLPAGLYAYVREGK